jgi:beta-N-acetylhexosaminidase
MYRWICKTTLVVILFFLNSTVLRAVKPCETVDPIFVSGKAAQWADSIMKSLTSEEKIAQLIIVAAWSNKDSAHIADIIYHIKRWGIGGLIFFQGGPVREALLNNYYQSISKVPLFIGMDAEWGLAMRLDSTIRYPRQMTTSAIRNDSLIYAMGNAIAKDCKRMGIHINFAPDADINNNPFNPIIGSRSFGDDRETVSKNSIAYMDALQDNHIIATGKHFPGHGNADTDSHLALPLISQDTTILDSVELYPFRNMICSGLTGMMVAHLYVPSLDTTPDLPSTLSKPIVKDLLRNKLGFNGLIFTDALNMKAVSSKYKPGELDKLALLAGNDVLLYSENVGKAILEIHYAIENCEITQGEIDDRVRKVLMAKYWCGLNQKQFIDTTNIYNDLNDGAGKLLQRKMYEESLTVLVNKDSLLPFRTKEDLKIASVVIGDPINNTLQQQLKMYGNVDVFAEDKDAPVAVFQALYNFLSNYDYVIISLHGTSMKAQTGFGIPEVARQFIDTIMDNYKSIFVDFGNAYTLSRFDKIKSAQAVILAYEDFPLTQSIAAQVIMGGISASGKLPVNSSPDFPKTAGVITPQAIRLQYTIPEAAGMSSSVLNRIDSVVNYAIAEKAMPGCQVLVARNGMVIYQKAFGSQTYNGYDTLRNTDLFDIASITKIAATALGTMSLYEKKKLNLTNVLPKYLPKIKGTNKSHVTVKEMLTHQAGFVPWIPFYKETFQANGLSTSLYSDSSSEKFSLQVADCLYLLGSYPDTIRNRIYNSPVEEKGKYVYSDLGPILMKDIIERITDEPFDKYIDENFYQPLHLSRTAFNPINKFNRSEIVPTENDTIFRMQLLRGYVHDPAAAMLGGVSGNAGVFSDANDLAVIMQMLLNKGTYGGRQYFKPSTVELFTQKQFPNNRRGLLFDKPETDPNKQSPCCLKASSLTFGHQGFTGTCAWVDPAHGLIYIFLSNRIHPNTSNDKLSKMNVRTRIQEIIYDSLILNP